MAANARAALLVDADNLSPEGMQQALAHLQAMNLDVCVRRAYGSPDTLGGAREFLLAHAVRPVVNQGKGTTDAALVVDAMDLLHAGDLPMVVALGSGDGDFAPLVLRLRESGRRMLCFAQRRKSAEGLDRFYAEVIYVDEPRAARGAARAAAAAPAAPAPAPARAAAKKASRKAPATRRAAAVPPPPPPAPPLDPVWAVLESVPGLLQGEEIELNVVVKKLRDEKLMSRSTSARNFFKKHAPEIELFPETQPNKLRLVRR